LFLLTSSEANKQAESGETPFWEGSISAINPLFSNHPKRLDLIFIYVNSGLRRRAQVTWQAKLKAEGKSSKQFCDA